MGSIRDRLKELRGFLGLTQDELASKTDTKRSTLAGYETGISLPQADFLEQLHTLFNVDNNWLIAGNGNMFVENPANALETINNISRIPLLHQKVSCGPGVDWRDEANIVDHIDVFNQIPHLKIERLFALCVRGSSMLGAGIRNGDYVLFDSALDQWPHDGIYVFALDGDVYCKRLEFDMTKIKIYSVRVTDLDKAELMRTLDTEDTSTADRLTIFGRVLYWVHSNLDDD
jgi:transcriptional regulator with XRE-family HTH domain